MRKILLILLIILLAIFPSCRPEIEHVEYDTSTWAGIFSSWWHIMNRNYVFWDLDSPGSEWDEVKNKFLPQMESYGTVGTNVENDKNALRVFFDIIKGLSDGHYSMDMTGLTHIRENITFSAANYRVLSAAGYSDDEIFQILIGEKQPDVKFSQSEAIAEGIYNIATKIFGISFSDSDTFTKDYKKYGLITGNSYFSELGYFRDSELTMVLGKIRDENILYFGFSGFVLSEKNDADLSALIIAFKNEIWKLRNGKSDTAGIIIDLRGNGGGSLEDMETLWGSLVENDLTFAKVRAKKSDNRLSYSSWQDIYIRPTIEGDKISCPIVLLTNKASGSCSELSTLFFHTLKEKDNINVTQVGGITIGATGPIYSDDSFFDAGYFEIPMQDGMISVMTPLAETRKYDGTSYERIGIEPDVYVSFDYSAFNSGKDARLDEAIAIIRAE